MEKIYISNTPIDALSSYDELSEILINRIKTKSRTLHILSANLQHIGLYNRYNFKSHKFNSYLSTNDSLTLIDGYPIHKKISRLLKGKNVAKLSGSDILPSILKTYSKLKPKFKIMIIGGDEYFGNYIKTYFEDNFKDCKFIHYSPDRIEISDPEYMSNLKKDSIKFKPDIILFNLPKPLSERLSFEVFGEIGSKINLSFGSALEFITGFKKRSPNKLSNLGLEWFYRFMQEPKRLFRRYFIEGFFEYFLLIKETGFKNKPLTPSTIRNTITTILLYLDISTLSLSILLSSKIRLILQGELKYFQPNIFHIILIFSVIMLISKFFRTRTPNALSIDSELFINYLLSLFLSITFIGFISYILMLEISRGFLLLLLFFNIFFGLVSRFTLSSILSKFRKKGNFLVPIYFTNSVKDHTILKDIQSNPQFGYHVLDKYNENLTYDSPTIILGDGDKEIIKNFNLELNQNGELVLLPSSLTLTPSRISIENIYDSSIMHLTPPIFSKTNLILKRIFDITLSVALMIFLSPIIISIFIILKIKGGKVFFSQKRIGRDNKIFNIYKFKTMIDGAESLKESLMEKNIAGDILFKVKDDPRVTPVGKFLRKYSLDELPQLYNIFIGEMSFVGPRPSLPEEVEKFIKISHIRHYLRPGLTGLWQINGRSNLDGEKGLRLDLHYILNWSLYHDFIILVKTLKAVINKDGAF